MNKTIFAAATALLLTAAGASAQILTAFNFNDGGASGAQATATTFASTGGLQSSTITTNFPAANTVVFAGTTVSAVNSDVAGNALAFQGGTGAAAGGTGGNNGAYFQFSISTANYTTLYLNYATRTSGTTSGFSLQTLSYSLDNGTTFTSFGTVSGYGTNFVAESVALPAAALNQTAVIIRNTFTGASTSTSNNRVDNLSVGTTALVPEPATYAWVVGGIGALALGMRRRRVA